MKKSIYSTVNIMPMASRNLVGADYFEYGGEYDQQNEKQYKEVVKKFDNETMYEVKGVEFGTIDNSLDNKKPRKEFTNRLRSCAMRSNRVLENLTDIVGDFKIEESNGRVYITTYMCRKVNNEKYEVKTIYTLTPLGA